MGWDGFSRSVQADNCAYATFLDVAEWLAGTKLFLQFALYKPLLDNRVKLEVSYDGGATFEKIKYEGCAQEMEGNAWGFCMFDVRNEPGLAIRFGLAFGNITGQVLLTENHGVLRPLGDNKPSIEFIADSEAQTPYEMNVYQVWPEQPEPWWARLIARLYVWFTKGGEG